MRVAYFIIGVATFHTLECYLLLQVRKGDNLSNVDALVHKQVLASKFDELARAARRSYQHKQYRIKGAPGDERVDSVVFAIVPDDNKHVKKLYGHQDSDAGGILSYMKQIADDLTRPKDARLNRRTMMNKNNMKQEHPSGNDKPSLTYEVDTTSVLDTVSDALSSKQARRYSDSVAKAAAYVYHAIMEA